MKINSKANGMVKVEGKNQGKDFSVLAQVNTNPLPESWWRRPEQVEWAKYAGIKELGFEIGF